MKQEMLSHVSFFLLFFSLCMRVHKIIGTHLVTKVYGGFYKHVLIFFFLIWGLVLFKIANSKKYACVLIFKMNIPTNNKLWLTM